MKNVLFAMMIGLVGVFAVGCGGDACEDALEVCGIEDGGDAADGAEAECTGAAECQANCIVDNDSCDFTDPESAVATCIADCGSAE